MNDFSTISHLCLFMLPATLYTASICVVCLVHEKEKTDLQCDMPFDAGIRHLNQIIEIMLGFSFCVYCSNSFLIRDCSHMSTYRFGPSETRYLLCHNNIIICRPRYQMYLYDIINGYLFLI